MFGIIFAAVGLFAGSLAVHVLLWRVRRPTAYRTWLPLLVIVFGPIATAAAWLLLPWTLELAAVLLLHYALAAVYIIGYTLISAFSPSVELLKLLERSGGAVPVTTLQLPFGTGALTDDRLRNLEQSRLVVVDRGTLKLGDAGRRITRLVLAYRHAIGLRDGSGG